MLFTQTELEKCETTAFQTRKKEPGNPGTFKKGPGAFGLLESRDLKGL